MPVYLHTIKVAPRREWLRLVDEYSLSSQSTSLTDEIRFKLVELLSLTSVSDAKEIDEHDVGLIVSVPRHRRGSIAFGLGLPLGWVPLVCVEIEVIELSSGKSIETLRTTVKSGWTDYLRGLLKINSLLHLKPEFGFHDLEPLIEKAIFELLGEIRTKYI